MDHRTRPAWSIFGILVGWLVAQLLIPETDFKSLGALAAPAWAMTLGLLFGPVIAGLGHLRSGFRTEHILCLALVFWILYDGISGAYGMGHVSHLGVQRAFSGIALFAIAMWVGSSLSVAFIRPRIHRAADRSAVSADYLFLAAVGAFAVGTFRITVFCGLDLECALESLSVPRKQASAYQESDLGRWASFVHHLRFFAYIVPSLAITILHLERKPSWRFWISVTLALFCVLTLIGDGGRRAVGVSIGGALLVWILLAEKLRWRHVLITVVLIPVLLYVMQAMVAYRHVGFVTGVQRGMDLDVPRKYSALTVDKNLFYLSFLMTLLPENGSYKLRESLTFYATLPIPRALYPSKPRSLGINLPRRLGWNVPKDFSVTMSAIGNFYLMAGFPAVLIGGLFFGALANACSRLLYRSASVQNRLLFGIGTMTLVVGLRSLHEVIVTGYAVLAVLLFFWARGFLVRSRTSVTMREASGGGRLRTAPHPPPG